MRFSIPDNCWGFQSGLPLERSGVGAIAPYEVGGGAARSHDAFRSEAQLPDRRGLAWSAYAARLVQLWTWLADRDFCSGATTVRARALGSVTSHFRRSGS